MYHTKCIDPWLTRGKRQCPICKRRIRNDGTCDMGSEQSDNVPDEEAPSIENSGERTPLVTNASRQYTGQSLRQPLGETSRDTVTPDDDDDGDDVTTDVSAAAAALAAEIVANNEEEKTSHSESSSYELTANEVGGVCEDKDLRVKKKIPNKRDSVDAQCAHGGKSIDGEVGRSTLV